jgi:hypothetical protein
MLVGVTVNRSPKSPLQKLDEARALWRAKGSKDYQMDVSFFGSFTFIGTFRIIVRENQVREILKFPMLSANIDNATPLESGKEKLDQSNYYANAISPDLKQYTVNGLFDIAAVKVENQPAPAEVAWCSNNVPIPRLNYNSEYGYILSFDVGNCIKWDFGGGLLCPIRTDCAANMSIHHYEALYALQPSCSVITPLEQPINQAAATNPNGCIPYSRPSRCRPC